MSSSQQFIINDIYTLIVKKNFDEIDLELIKFQDNVYSIYSLLIKDLGRYLEEKWLIKTKDPQSRFDIIIKNCFLSRIDLNEKSLSMIIPYTSKSNNITVNVEMIFTLTVENLPERIGSMLIKRDPVISGKVVVPETKKVYKTCDKFLVEKKRGPKILKKI